MSKSNSWTRREFLQRAILAGGGIALTGTALKEALTAERPKAKVVIVTCDGVMKDERHLNVGALRRMLERGITELAGKPEVKEAWRTFIRPTDRVALVDAGTWLLNVPQVVVEVAKGIASAKPQSFKLTYCALDPQRWVEAVRRGLQQVALPADLMDGKVYTFPGRFQRHPFTTIVMTPTLKSHTVAGVSGVVKHYATLSKVHVSNYHPNAMETAGSVLRSEFGHLRHLIIVDALRFGETTRGPQFYQQSLLFGTDPVAVDVVALEVYLRNCRTHGNIPPDRHRILADTRYHAGISDRSRIEVKELKV